MLGSFAMSEESFTEEGRVATAAQVLLVLRDGLLERASAAKHLRSSGFDVIVAEDYDEARRILEGGHVDVVFADLEMLGQANGLRLVRRLREGHPAIKTILTSDTEANIAAVEDCGIFLSKPYRLVDLDYCLQRVLATTKISANQTGGVTSTDLMQTGLGSSKPPPGNAS